MSFFFGFFVECAPKIERGIDLSLFCESDLKKAFSKYI